MPFCFEVSMNYQREMENRQRENEMKRAIDEWRERTDDEFHALVVKQQVGPSSAVVRNASRRQGCIAPRTV